MSPKKAAKFKGMLSAHNDAIELANPEKAAITDSK